MKRLAVFSIVLLMLTGCARSDGTLDRAMALRARLLGSSGCAFDAVVTADHGDKTNTFSVSCKADTQGNVDFTVKGPETIAGISGTISHEGGKMTFDDKALAFEMLADEQVTPAIAPWLLVKTLTGGYVTACGQDGERIRVSIDDSYEEDALHLDIWLGEGDLPVMADILYRDRRILSLKIDNFEVL